MPGISLHFSYQNIGDDNTRRFHSLLKDLCHFPVYHSEIYHEDQNLLAGISGYDAYPVMQMRIGEIKVFFEGRIYDCSEIETRNKLSRISAAFGDDKDKADNLARIIYSEFCHCDCEFWAVMYNPSRRRMLIFNDSFGRLPVYYHQDSQGLTVSREIKFIRQFKQIHQFDKQAIAQVLMLKYPQGRRTLSQNINRLPYAALISDTAPHPNFKIERYQTWDISEYTDDRSFDYYLEQSIERFRPILKNREDLYPENHPMLALSGGLDSRAILAGLLDYGLQPSCASSLLASGGNRADVKIAEEICAGMNLEFKRVELKPYEFEDFQLIAYLRDGLNNVVMSSALGLYENFLNKAPFGVNLFTGDGGIALKTVYRMGGRINSEKQILKYVFSTNANFPVNLIENLLSVSLKDSKSEFIERIRECQAEGWNERYLYHIIFEYLTNYGYEGEERSRYYFWLQAPFEAIPFYSYALRIPDKYKSGLKLIAAFIRKLQPQLLRYDYADYNAPVDSRKTRFSLKAKAVLQNHPQLFNMLRRILFSQRYRAASHSKPFLNQIMDLISQSDLIPQVFNRDYLVRVIEKSDLIQYHQLVTVLLYINRVEMERNAGN